MTKYEMIVKSLQSQGFSKELEEISLSDVQTFIAENGIQITNENGEAISIDELFQEYSLATSAVEEVVEPAVEEVVETSSIDESTEEINEPIVEEKSLDMEQNVTVSPTVLTIKSIKSSPLTGVTKMDTNNIRKKTYNIAAQSRSKWDRTGSLPIFPDADRAEIVAAHIRLTALHGKDYSQRLNDEAIVKSTGTTTNSTYAAPLIVERVAPEILDALPLFGAVRNLVQVKNMAEGVLEFTRGTADPLFYNTAQGGGITAGVLAYDRVVATAIKASGLLHLSNELVNDSAFDISEEISKRFMRGLSKFEDTTYFAEILAGMTGSSSYNAGTTGATKWSTVDSDDITDWLGQIPNRAWQDGTVKIACSSQFYNQVFRRIAAGSGGTDSIQLLRGLDGQVNGRVYSFDGIPVIVTDVLPSVWGAGQYPAYAGSFELGTVFGVVRDSAQLATSTDFKFNEDVFSARMTERFAVKAHEVGTNAIGGGVNSMVVGFLNNT